MAPRKSEEVGGASSSTSKKRKRVGKDNKEVPEKRLARYLPTPNVHVKERIARAFSHRLYLISKTVIGEPNSPRACEFVVLGNTGNVYTVKLQQTPQCNCPDYARGHLCKHYLFVLLRVLKLTTSDPRVWQRALLSSELSDLLRNPAVGDGVLASQSVIARFQEIIGGKASGEGGEGVEHSQGVQRPVEGDCPICYELLVSKTMKAEAIVFCKSCGNNVHQECFRKWSKTKSPGKVTCIYCRALWDEVPKKQGSGKIGAESYVNLAAYSQSHLEADNSLETLYPNSYEWMRRMGSNS